jgi:DNA polymerase III epsilon subunit-like protein
VVDVEGNGRQLPDIVEIAIVHMSGLVIGETKTWLLKPSESITPYAKRVHGISNADVKACPSWDEVADDVRVMLTGRVLVAHSAPVELGILEPRLRGWTPTDVLDTLQIARRLRSDLPRHGLEALLAEYGIHDVVSSSVSTGPHRAGYDALGTAHLLVALAHTADGGVRPFEEMVRSPNENTKTGQQELF